MTRKVSCSRKFKKLSRQTQLRFKDSNIIIRYSLSSNKKWSEYQNKLFFPPGVRTLTNILRTYQVTNTQDSKLLKSLHPSQVKRVVTSYLLELITSQAGVSHLSILYNSQTIVNNNDISIYQIIIFHNRPQAQHSARSQKLTKHLSSNSCSFTTSTA